MKNGISELRIIWAFFALLALFAGPKVFALELIRDGQAASAIVLPDNASALEKEGAQILVKYLKTATGAELPVVEESKKPAGAIIAFGKTRMAERAGISAEGLKYDGYKLRVKQGAFYILGRDTEIIKERGQRIGAQGSVRAALGFLEKLGFRWLQPTPTGIHAPALQTVSVADDLDFTCEPVFGYVGGRMHTWGDWSLANSYRKAILVYSAGGHTWDLAVPAALWDGHPEYFRMQGGVRSRPSSRTPHPCSSNPDVVRLVTEYTLKKFNEGYELVALGHTDGFQPCECDACRKYKAHDQVHNLQRQVIQAADEKHPDRFVHLLIYSPSLTPPSCFEKYPPNTVAEICLTGSMADEYGSHAAALEFWRSKIPGGVTVYVYYMGLYHSIGMAPKFTPRAADRNIRMLQAHGVKGIYYCGGGENWGAEGPTYYVLGRLATDPTQDWRDLVGEYCKLTFGKAGKTMLQYYDLLYKRIDNYDGGRGTGAEVFTAVYTPEVLEQLANLLALAGQQAAGDERALGWIRLAQISYNHFALIAKTFHFYQSYVLNPTMENLKQVRDAVRAYHAFVDELAALPKDDSAFVKNYFPEAGLWTTETKTYGSLKTNCKKLSSPFTWDFEALLKSGMLPGKTRAEAVFTRLSSAPAVDGDLSEEAWEAAPWIDAREVALGAAEATTRVRLGYDNKNLYFAFECGEPRLDEMKVIEYGRDGLVYNTECVEIFLAPDGAGQKRIQLIISPTDAGRWDGRYGYIDDPLHPLALSDSPDTTWNPDYRHAFKVDQAGKKWTMEIAFPFAELGMDVPADGMRWRGNFGRERHMRIWDPKKYYGKSELFLWSPNLQKASFTDPTAFGELYFGNIPGKGFSH